MPSYKDHAISLKTAPFAEADKMVTLFTRKHGKIRAIAKGARKVPSRLAGRVEPLTYAECFIAKGRSLDIISQCQVLEAFHKVREGDNALPAGLYILKLVNSGTVDGQRYPELFDLLLKVLFRLIENNNPRKVVEDFEREFVKLEGIHKDGEDPRYSLSEHIGMDVRSW